MGFMDFVKSVFGGKPEAPSAKPKGWPKKKAKK